MGIQQNSTIHGHVWWIQPPQKKNLAPWLFVQGCGQELLQKFTLWGDENHHLGFQTEFLGPSFEKYWGRGRRTSQNAFQAKIVSKFIEDFDLDVKISIKWNRKVRLENYMNDSQRWVSPTMYNVPAHPNAPVVPGKKSLYSILPLLQWKLASTEPTWSRILGWESCILK